MKKGKLILSIIVFILSILVIGLWDEMIISGNIMLDCWEDYHNEFSFQSIFIDDEEKEISITFKCEGNASDENVDIITILYNHIFKIVFNEYNQKWAEYRLNININHTSKMTLFAIWNITEKKEEIEIMASFSGVSISSITKLCPEVATINLTSLQYENKEEFDKFTNLKSIWFRGTTLDADVENYILSKFPDCEISWKEE